MKKEIKDSSGSKKYCKQKQSNVWIMQVPIEENQSKETQQIRKTQKNVSEMRKNKKI